MHAANRTQGQWKRQSRLAMTCGGYALDFRRKLGGRFRVRGTMASN
jgi:hypothetical protein